MRMNIKTASFEKTVYKYVPVNAVSGHEWSSNP